MLDERSTMLSLITRYFVQKGYSYYVQTSSAAFVDQVGQILSRSVETAHDGDDCGVQAPSAQSRQEPQTRKLLQLKSTATTGVTKQPPQQVRDAKQ